MLGQNFNARVHSTHKIKLSMPYKGLQPMEDATKVRKFGRYGTAHQAIYEYDDCTIGTYKNRLVIWVRNPKGIRTEEQRINAKLEGYRFLRQFAQEHNLKLEGYLDKVELSHHVVVNNPLNESVKKNFTTPYGKEIYEQIGTHECKTSHPGRIEHEGRVREDRIVRGDQVAIGLEYLTLDFRKKFEETDAKIDRLNEFSDKIELYTEQIALHLDVEAATLKTQEETMKTLKAIQKGLAPKEEIK